MIIVGTYPDGFKFGDDSRDKLSTLNQTLSMLLPRNVCLHILPFYPNSGDFGFAPDDWFRIREDLGEWSDLSNIASRWKVLVDGIYNHVGVNHKWARKFKENPEYYKTMIYAYKTNSSDDGPTSPRGQPVLTKTDYGYFLWKTFSDVAVDIRLQNPIVQKQIGKHLSHLSSLGVWGVRLDAVAYYAKSLGSQIRHNHGVYELANTMADRVRSYGLKVLAQLDCDEDGLRYYSDNKRRNIPVNDFTYSTYLALSILEGDPTVIVRHVTRTQKAERILVRIPRTHDGILLRSRLLHRLDKEKIIGFAKSKQIQVRMSSGEPYELNCSGPYLYSLLASEVEVHKAILFTVAITGMMSGWSYFYLPYLMGHTPERYASQNDFEDPRALNRLPITSSILNSYLKSPYKAKLFSLLQTLSKIHSSQGEYFKTNCCVKGKLLVLWTIDSKYVLIANFGGPKDRKIVDGLCNGKIVEQNDFDRSMLGRLGFVIMSMV